MTLVSISAFQQGFAYSKIHHQYDRGGKPIIVLNIHIGETSVDLHMNSLDDIREIGAKIQAEIARVESEVKDKAVQGAKR